MAEVRTLREGALYWVAASATGSLTAWQTASAPASGLFGYVRSFTFTSGATYQAISERGTPMHWKKMSLEPINGTITFDWTGTVPTFGYSGASASVPTVHLEYKATQPELGNTGRYFQFHSVVVASEAWTEGAPDNYSVTFNALSMSGANASGYMA
jgi:hypothetical protein